MTSDTRVMSMAQSGDLKAYYMVNLKVNLKSFISLGHQLTRHAKNSTHTFLFQTGKFLYFHSSPSNCWQHAARYLGSEDSLARGRCLRWSSSCIWNYRHLLPEVSQTATGWTELSPLLFGVPHSRRKKLYHSLQDNFQPLIGKWPLISTIFIFISTFIAFLHQAFRSWKADDTHWFNSKPPKTRLT